VAHRAPPTVRFNSRTGKRSWKHPGAGGAAGSSAGGAAPAHAAAAQAAAGACKAGRSLACAQVTRDSASRRETADGSDAGAPALAYAKDSARKDPAATPQKRAREEETKGGQCNARARAMLQAQDGGMAPRGALKHGTKVTAAGRDELVLARMEEETRARGFSLTRVLGAGSYGCVVHARDPRGSTRAIKEIKGVAEDRRRGLMCLREVSILRRLEHPNIVNLVDAFASGDRAGGAHLPICTLYLVFEYCDTDLRQLLSGGRTLALEDVRCLIRQLCAGVCFLHRACVIHRDLKPANILVNTAQGLRLKIADFGFARVLDTCAAQTLGGEILEEPHTDSDGKEDDHLAGTLSSPLEEGEVPPSPLEEGEVPPPPRHPLGVADQPGVGGGSHAAAAAAGASRFRKPPPAPLELSRHTQTGVKAVRAPPLTAHVVTRVYRAPEVILCRGRYAQSIDNWSLGCIIAEILQFLQPPAAPRCPLFRSKTWHGPSPRQDAHAREQLAAIFRVCGTPSIQEVKGLASVTDAEALLLPPGWLIKLAHGPPLPPAWPAYGEGVPAEATRLLRGLLRFLARDRLTARQALEHPFLRPASHASHGAGACPSGGAVAQRELAEAATLHKAWGDRGGGGQSPLPLSAGPQVRKEMSGMGLERLGEQELYEIFRREIGACFLASPRARRVSGGYGA